jgi:hypothetical protein
MNAIKIPPDFYGCETCYLNPKDDHTSRIQINLYSPLNFTHNLFIIYCT